MLYLDCTLSTPAQNLALDDYLLSQCDSSGQAVLRFWMPDQWFVVLGYANRLAKEIYKTRCQRDEVPVLRRISGGGTVLQGPCCLNYTLVLPIDKYPDINTVGSTTQWIMARNRESVSKLVPDVGVKGHSDLVVNELKFSGNAQRRLKRSVLFHGTFLLDGYQIDRVGTYLRFPPKVPDYRQKRSHEAFICTLPVEAEALKQQLSETWQVSGRLAQWDEAALVPLVAEKYENVSWNQKY